MTWLRLVILIGGAGAAGCSDYSPLQVPARSGPPYLAILTTTEAPPGIVSTGGYRYRVKESSLSLGLDTVITVGAIDTLLLSVPPATYEVSIADVPPECRVQANATKQSAVLVAETNTAILRFVVFCRAQLVIENLTSGQQPDDAFVLRIDGPSGGQRVDLIGAQDTVLLDGLEPGRTTVRLGHVAQNCEVVSDHGPVREVVVTATGGVDLAFRVACSDPAARPTLKEVAASYQGGVNGFVLHAVDPNRDIERYFWDLTDCHRNSLIGDGGRTRGGLSRGRTGNLDSIVVIGLHEVELPDSIATRGCVALRVEDVFGNSSAIVEAPLRPRGGAKPFPLAFNASLFDQIAIRTLLLADDPDGDYLGFFGTARLNDGTLGPTDGRSDIGIFNTAGYLGTTVPEVPLGSGRPVGQAYQAIILYLFDRTGQFRRIEDSDLSR
jgi:hypothetical protein